MLLKVGEENLPGLVELMIGTAIEALPLMKSIIGQRPTTFRSVIDAIHWQ
jgi:protein phosphatase methylesterase 1